MRKTVCNVFADLDTSHLAENNIRFFDPTRFDLDTIFIGKKEPKLYEILRADGYQVTYYPCSSRAELPRAVLKLASHFRRVRPHIVHTHLFNAAFAGMTAAKLLGIPNRVNTRHHAAELHLFHPHAVYYDRFLNRIATHIVAITDMVADVLVQREGVARDKVQVIRHGFDIEGFDSIFRQPGNLRSKYGLTEDYPVIGMVSRHMEGKGIQYVIPAFRQVLGHFPKAKLVLANAYGPYNSEIMKALSTISPDRYRLIHFEHEIFDLYKSFDLFVHVPISEDYEAFGQVYIEALAMRLPCIFTISGVAKDFIRDDYNALVVPHKDSKAIGEAMSRLIVDDGLRQKLGENGFRSIREEFAVKQMIDKLTELYDSMEVSHR